MNGLEDLLGFNRRYSRDEVINKIGQLKHIQALRPKNDFEKVFLREEIDMLCELVELKDKQAEMDKLLNLLKEKNVDLGYIKMEISNCETQELASGMKFSPYDYIEELTDTYNTHIALSKNIEYKLLFQEEMQLIVKWLKEKK